MIGAVPRAVVCLPTYNERANVEPLLLALLEQLGPDDRVLVIDDASPDGTGELAERIAAEHSRVSVLHRPRKEGLGPAYCDFSHSPADVPRLIEASGRADLVLGSRYVRDGRIENWSPLRRLVSRAGSFYAQVLLLAPIRDLTGGFKCYRRAVLERIDLDAISSLGYAFQIETTYRALRAGFRVVEVPITFVDREEGSSKMSRAIVLEAIWRVPYLAVLALLRRLR
jgi:dolichol-phosphate mannosyltransferase